MKCLRKTIRTISEYIDIINIFRNQVDSTTKILFRGQANAKWKIESSLERIGLKNLTFNNYYTLVDSYKPEINAYGKKFSRKVTCNGYDFDFSDYSKISYDGFPEIEYLTYLRHHGFPSPLIDVTLSEYIALFFACEDAVGSANEIKSGKVFVLQSELWNHAVSGYTEIYEIGRYIETDLRHLTQQSEYLVACCYDLDKREWKFVPFDLEGCLKEASQESNSILEIQIPASVKGNLLKELDKMNINHYTLYRDEDSLMKKMKFDFLAENGRLI
ncbi:FRG domain-containing protein [uncultured Fibrobacter sp.]|uniref:FRG domain-containing protein n=1 Tax=uncultured Fibrobacter sp. TaxID=261512 RepID=UPI0025E0D0F4|nr:FRG domain-containing protein [uncultured Fibrobacter sp.]